MCCAQSGAKKITAPEWAAIVGGVFLYLHCRLRLKHALEKSGDDAGAVDSANDASAIELDLGISQQF